MDRQQQLEQKIKRLASRSWWIGLAFGLVLGFAAGFMVGAAQGWTTTVIVPLTEGIKT